MQQTAVKPVTPQLQQRQAQLEPSVSNKRETAQYISDMVLELRNMAKSHGFLTLQGLLEVAYYEAFSAATAIEIPPDEVEHIKQLSRAATG